MGDGGGNAENIVGKMLVEFCIENVHRNLNVTNIHVYTFQLFCCTTCYRELINTI